MENPTSSFWAKAQSAPFLGDGSPYSQTWPELGMTDAASDPGQSTWAPAWSDLMMVLFVLFCVLFVYALNHQQARDAFRTISPAMDSTDSFGDTGQPVYRAEVRAFSSPTMRSLQARIASLLSAFPKDRVCVGQSRSSHVSVRVKNAFLFTPGRSDLASGSSLLLNKMASFLRTYSNDVHVVGHVDQPPEGTNAWQLSAERAGKIVARFVGHYGFSPERFTVQAYGSSDPLVPGREAEDLEANNRLEIRIMAPGIARPGPAWRADGSSI